MKSKLWLMAATLLLLGACSKEGDKPAAPVPSMAVRQFDTASITRGARLFEEHCVICHGPQAQGHPDWQTPSDGSFAAAPGARCTARGIPHAAGEDRSTDRIRILRFASKEVDPL